MKIDANKILAKVKKAGGRSKLGLSGGRNKFMEDSNFSIWKYSLENNKTVLFLVLEQMNFPFDPINMCELEDNQNEYIVRTPSPKTFMLTIKSLANSNPEVKKFWEDKFGHKWDTSKVEELNKEDLDNFKSYREVMHFWEKVRPTKLDATAKYSTHYIVTDEINEKGEIVRKSMLTKLAELEHSFHKKRVEKLKEEYSTGKKKHKTNEDFEKEVVASAESKRVGKEVNKGFVVGLKIEIDNKTGEIVGDDAKAFEEAGGYNSIKYNLHTFTGFADMLKKIENNIHNNSANAINFVPMCVTTTNESSKKKKDRPFALWTNKSISFDQDFDYDKILPEAKTSIREMVREILDDGSIVTEKAIYKSSFTFNTASPEILLDAYRNIIQIYEYEYDEEIRDEHGDLIEMINSDWKKKVDALISGESAKTEKIEKPNTMEDLAEEYAKIEQEVEEAEIVKNQNNLIASEIDSEIEDL